MHLCKTCGFEGPVEKFGKTGRSSIPPYRCLPCCAANTKKYAAKNRVHWATHDPYTEHSVGSKKCPGCKKTLQVKEFSRRAASADGLTSRCRHCERHDNRKRLYNVDKQAVQQMREAQRNRCNICSKELNGATPHVDHDHDTGKVRALLCSTCNSGLGHFKEDPRLLANAALYLEIHAA